MPSTQHSTHSTDAERTVLGCLLLDGETIHTVVGKLQPDDFFDPIHKSIFAAICEIYADAQPIDFVTVSNKLESDPKIKSIGGSAFIAELSVDVPTSSHIGNYATIVKDHSIKRQIKRLGQEVAVLAESSESSTNDLIETVEQKLLNLGYAAVQEKPQPLRAMDQERYDHYLAVYESDNPAALHGIQTGFTELDEKIVGLRAGDVMVLAGRPSMGKTAIALQIARNVAAEQQKKVTVLSLEMNKEQLFDRLFAAFHEVDEHRLSKGELNEKQMESMGSTFDRIAQLELYIDDDTDKSMTNLRSKARRHAMEHGIDLLIIDYMQLIQVPANVAKQNRTEQLRYVSESIKSLAREINAPVLALSQLNRDADKRTDKRPQLSDLRESGAIEQDADYALMLYRDSYYDEDCEHPEITDLYLRKNRPHGETGHIEIRFDKSKHQFFDAEK